MLPYSHHLALIAHFGKPYFLTEDDFATFKSSDVFTVISIMPGENKRSVRVFVCLLMLLAMSVTTSKSVGHT